MFGSDIDAHSLEFAKQNVQSHGLEQRVRVRRSLNPEAPLIPLDAMGVDELNFVMTNPPFYSSEEDMQSSYIGKDAPPSAVCTGSENEMICPGGDVGFITRILDESLVLREKVQWYTAMVGKMSSLQTVIAKLKEHGITNFAVTCLQAGHRTKRWAVAWSFQEYRPRNDVARHGELVLAVLPQATAQTIFIPGVNAKAAGQKVDATLRELDVRWRWRVELGTGVMEAKENAWSRSARRKKKFAATNDGSSVPAPKNGDDSDEDEDEEEVGLAVKIACRDGEVDLRWLRGKEYVLWESFCGLMKRTMNARS